MAKHVKAKKGDVILVFNLWTNGVQTSKIAADGAKYVAIRKALKKPIKDFIEARALLDEEGQKLIRALDKESLQPLRTKIANAKNEPEKKMAESQLTAKASEINALLAPHNEKGTDLFNSVKNEEAEVVFDNEDFLFFSKLCTDNSAELCSVEIPQEGKEPVKRLNAEALEILFDFLSAVE